MAARGEPCFGDFRLDLVNEILWRGGSEVRLTPRAFVLLRHLVEHHDRLVTKDELLDAVWRGLHVGDSVVKVRIGELRHALADPVAEPRYIATIHRRGYRFVAPVTDAGGPATSGSAMPGPATLATRPATSVLPTAPARSRTRPAETAVPPLRAQHLVGRQPVLARLDDRLARALDGDGQVVFLAGDAGMGKTSLIEAFLERARRVAGIWLAIGRCVEHYGTGEPYLPLLEALGRLCQDARGHLLIEVLRRHAPMWLLQLPWLLDPPERVALQREVIGGTKERMLRELISALAAFTAEHPLILALEDLHWSDASTLDLVRSLAQSRHPARLLVVLTYRASDAIARGHPVRTLRNDLRVHGDCDEEILELLSAPDIADYLAARLSLDGQRHEASSDALSSALAAIVHRRTDGNPLFMASLIDEVIRRGMLQDSEDGLRLRGDPAQLEIGVPASVREMIERDYDRLDRSDRDLLEAASVAGVEFSARIVAAALDSNPVDVERRCDELARSRQFLRACEMAQWPDGAVDASYAFRHALYQEVLYAETPPARRMRLHRRLGECLEEKLDVRANARAAELALHFERGRDPVRAVGHLRRAAENAVRRCANREAIETLTRAADLLAELPGEVSDTIELDLREQIGLVRRSMGDMGGAARDFDSLVELAQRLDRPDREAKGLLYLCSALTWIDRERRSATLAEAIRVAARVEDGLLRAHALGYAAYWNLSLRGWREEDERACTAAVEAARQRR